MKTNKLTVDFFQRKPRPGFNFSLEQIFDDIRNRLNDKIESVIHFSPLYNDGYLSKFKNIYHAYLNRGEINHVTGEVHFLDLLMKKKSVILTILDCRFMERKNGIQKKIIKLLYLDLPIKKADFVTAISSVTKNEIIKYTNCNPSKIHIIPVAVSDIYKPFKKNFNKDCPSILQIGTAENKNINRTIEALKNIVCKLVIIGKLSAEHISILQSCNVNFENYYNLSQNELLHQYNNCDIVSFASTFEGFGMPIIEANCVERVVLTSNISAMPEVAGNAACLVDPYNTNSIRDGFLKIINDDSYREMLIQNGRVNKMRFNGETIANQYYNIYNQIAGSK